MGRNTHLKEAVQKNPYCDHISQASNWATLRRRMQYLGCPSCECIRTGRARDGLPCWAGWMVGETERAPFLFRTNSTTVWFRICNTREWEKQGWIFKYQLHSDLFYNSLGVKALFSDAEQWGLNESRLRQQLTSVFLLKKKYVWKRSWSICICMENGSLSFSGELKRQQP